MLKETVTIVIVVMYLFPFFYMVISSFKTPLQAQAYPPAWLFKPTLENYSFIIRERNILKYFTNSVIVAFGNTLFSLCLALPASWSMARFRLKGKETIAYLFLVLQMTPAISIVFAFYFLVRAIGLYDTHIALIVIYSLWHVPWTIWLTRGFFESIPASLEESAVIDGCSRFGAFIRVTLPLAVPGIVAASVFVFIMSWNEFTVAYFLTLHNAPTLTTTISFFRTRLGIFWGQMFATATLSTLPVVIFAVFLRKYLIAGLTLGAVKE